MTAELPAASQERLHRAIATARDLPGTKPRLVRVDEVGVAARSFRDGRAGFAAASGLDVDAARRAVEGALGLERELSFDPLPPERLLGTVEVPEQRPLPPKGWARHIVEQLAASFAGVSERALALRRSVLQEGNFAWMLTREQGFLASHSGTSTALLVELVTTEERSGVWRDWLHIPDPAAFDPESVAARIADRVLLTRSKVATDSGLRDLILGPEVAARLLAALAPLFLSTPAASDPLTGLLNADGQLASPPLTVLDDRLDPLAPITGPCDGEGLPAGRTLLLDEGVPRHRIGSYRDAVASGDSPRGGALRLSYRDYPATGIANLRVDVSEGLTPSGLLGAADRALYLLRPLAPISCDAATDSYRIVASGVWLQGQQVSGWHPVVELAGSLGRLLRRIEAVGTDLTWFQTERGCVGSPSLLVRHEQVVG
jgi:PmbA protein